jgi:N,N'-diacetylchitobiose transport system substrate-binding protein
MERLAGKDSQRALFKGMGFLPTYTDVRAEAAKSEPFVEPFVKTLGAGAKFVPASPAWAKIDASLVLPTMFQEVVSGRKDVAAAAGDAAKKMDDAFGSAG